ncbi:MAG: sigma-70 family RNA polymerase sigma factor [Gemmataceae bacterium]
MIENILRIATFGANMGDGELLGSFIDDRDPAAIAVIVRRHGPMVWGVCRRLLNEQDAEDAFQATFLVLVRKAASVEPRARVGNWLYGVAHHAALQAKRSAGRRGRREVLTATPPDTHAMPEDRTNEVQPFLDQELSGLADIYREVIVLCDLEGRTRSEVAQQLGVPEGTVAGRLARARTKLAQRLTRRGIALSIGALAGVLAQSVASAKTPPDAIASTIEAASAVAGGQSAAVAASSPQAAQLTSHVMGAMSWAPLKAMAIPLLLLGVATTTAAAVWLYREARGPDQATLGLDPAPRPVDVPRRLSVDLEAMQGTWMVVGLQEGGKEQPKERFENVKMRLVVEGRVLSIFTTALDGRKMGQLGLDIALEANANPKQIDASKAGKLMHGIYVFEAEKLKLCIDMSGASRPETFQTIEGSQQRSYVLQRNNAK